MAATVAIGPFATFQTGANSGDRQFRSRRHAGSHNEAVGVLQALCIQSASLNG